ncbi:ankyrin repeat-containing domain protein [Xylaria venustula]|nr:ankyrin repeat-containing domain protein [Xylaria venustula]
MVSNTGEDALVETLRPLCHLALRSDLPRYAPSPSDLEADLCFAAIYLSHHVHDSSDDSDVRSSVFGLAIVAATFRSNASMMRLLLSSNPNYNPSEAIPYRETFDFAIDSRPLGINKVSYEISKHTTSELCPFKTLGPEYKLNRKGVNSTSVSASECHIGIAQFFPNSTSSERLIKESLERALLKATRNGNLQTVNLPLQHGVNLTGLNVGPLPSIVIAVFKEDAAMFHLLCNYGAALDTPETGGWAMAVAQFWGFESMRDMLVQKGVEKDVVLHRCPEERELRRISWYIFLERDDIDGDREIAELLWSENSFATRPIKVR